MYKLNQYKYSIVSIAIVCIMFYLSSFVVVYAEDIVNQSQVVSLIDKYPLYNYKSYMKDESGLFSLDILGYMNMVVNVFLQLNVLEVRIVDLALQHFMGHSAINLFIDTVAGTSNKIYNNLFSTLAGFFFLISISMIVYKGFIQQSIKVASTKFFKLLGIIALGVIWVNSAGEIVKNINLVSEAMQTSIMTSVSDVSNSLNKTSYDKLENLDKQRSTLLLRDQFYELALLKPYLVINYGVIDSEKIGQERLEQFLTININDEKYKDDKKYTDDIETIIDEEIEKNNIYVRPIMFTSKFVTSFLAPIITLGLSMPFLLIAFLNLFVDILILISVVLVPIFLILAVLEMFGDLAMKGFMNLISLFILKAFLGFIVVSLFLVIEIIEKIVPDSLGDIAYFLSSIVLIVIYVLLWKNKDKLMTVLSLGVVKAQSKLGGDSALTQQLLLMTLLNKNKEQSIEKDLNANNHYSSHDDKNKDKMNDYDDSDLFDEPDYYSNDLGGLDSVSKFDEDMQIEFLKRGHGDDLFREEKERNLNKAEAEMYAEIEKERIQSDIINEDDLTLFEENYPTVDVTPYEIDDYGEEIEVSEDIDTNEVKVRFRDNKALNVYHDYKQDTLVSDIEVNDDNTYVDNQLDVDLGSNMSDTSLVDMQKNDNNEEIINILSDEHISKVKQRVFSNEILVSVDQELQQIDEEIKVLNSQSDFIEEDNIQLQANIKRHIELTEFKEQYINKQQLTKQIEVVEDITTIAPEISQKSNNIDELVEKNVVSKKIGDDDETNII